MDCCVINAQLNILVRTQKEHLLPLQWIMTDKEFTDKFNELKPTHLTAREIAGELGVGRTTILRWMHGKSAPHRFMREIVLSYLEEKQND